MPEFRKRAQQPQNSKRVDPTAMVVTRMVEAVLLQAEAIVEIQPHHAGPMPPAVRVQGGWETVRVVVSRSSDDTAAEAAVLEAVVWPELHARCAARRLHLLPIDARQGQADDAIPPTACLGQITTASHSNEGVPFVLCVHGAKPGWTPPLEAVGAFGDGWVHGLSLGAMEAFEAACRMKSQSTLLLARAPNAAPNAALGPHHGAHQLGSLRSVLRREQASALTGVLRELIARRLPAAQMQSYSPAAITAAGPDSFADLALEGLWTLISRRYPAEPRPPPPPAPAALPPEAPPSAFDGTGGAVLSGGMTQEQAATVLQKHSRGYMLRLRSEKGQVRGCHRPATCHRPAAFEDCPAAFDRRPAAFDR